MGKTRYINTTASNNNSTNLQIMLPTNLHFYESPPFHILLAQLTYLNIPTALEGGVRLHCIRAVAESEDGGE